MADQVPVEDVLVLVPGILGSQLIRTSDRAMIWGDKGTIASLARPSRLRLRGDGFGPDPGVAPVGLVRAPAQLPGLAKIAPYDRLIRRLHATFALDDTNFLVFPYDWRLSCETNARLLATSVEHVLTRRRRLRPDAELIFLAHSMGGLIVQYFTDVLGGAAATKRIMTIGTPFRGAAKTFGAITVGLPPSLPVLRSLVRTVVRSFPSVYELLPRYRAVIEGDSARRLAATDLTDSESRQRFVSATGFHDSIDRGDHRRYTRTVIVGTMQPTPQFVQISDGNVSVLKRWHQSTGGSIDERGDGTVPRQSVTPPDWQDDADATPFSQGHVALPGAEDTLRVLHQVLTARPRSAQAHGRAALAVDIPDVVATIDALDVRCEVASGDRDIPLRIRVEPLNGGAAPAAKAPREEDGELIARFYGLEPGDYRVTLEPGIVIPDVQQVWDLVTVYDDAHGTEIM